MPRIDPERLLKCLQPLLEPTSGAIRSVDEVDKILGLMSKFSKKLVSKCIYINILRASHPTVVDLFMERGGWNLIFGWTNDAIASKNYALLKEIFHLLLVTPVNVPRLKSNRFPIVIKNYSKDSEDEETRLICKHVVQRWITIAKTEEKTDPQQQLQQQQQQNQISHPQLPVPPPPPTLQVQQQQEQQQLLQQQANPIEHTELANLENMNLNTDHLLNIDPASITAMIPDNGDGNQALMDLDFSQTDLAGIDFNFDILNKMVADGHNLEETISGGAPMIQQTQIAAGQEIILHQQQHHVQPSSAPISVIQHAPSQQQQQQIIHIQHQQQQPHPPQQQHQIIYEQPSHHQVITSHPQQIVVTQNSIAVPTSNVIHISNLNSQQIHMIQQQSSQQHQQQQHHPNDPQHHLIPLVPVQTVQPTAAPKLIIKRAPGQQPVVQNLESTAGQFCFLQKDGKNYLVRLKEPQPAQNIMAVTTTSSANPVTSVVIQHQGAQIQVPDSSKVPPLVTQDNIDGAPSKKLKSPKKEPQAVSPVNKVPGDLKTYSKSSSSSSGGSSKDKKSSSSGDHKDKKSKSSSGSGDSHSHHHHKKSKSSSSSASSKAAAAATAQKKLEEDERLRDKIRKEKALMKKRQKEADKQKQQTEKDQETLKKLNLGPTTSSPNPSGKIPKIPKRNASSFADAIGIPGGSESADKIKKVSSSDKDKKEKSPHLEEPTTTISPTKKFYGKGEDEAAEEARPKERRHKAKVYVSSKSRSDDLLKEMEGGNGGGKTTSSKDKEKDKEKEEKEVKLISLGNSIPATPPKMSKRLSTDSLEKPGDIKKAKLEQEKLKESSKEKSRKVVAPITLKESSSFMDAISASTESLKSTKKKRRTSSGGDSKELLLPPPKLGSIGDDEVIQMDTQAMVTTPTEEPAVKKPVFNFYRETLNDEDDDSSEVTSGGGDGEKISDNKMDETGDSTEAGSFTPQENDGKVKSALVLVRPRNRPKKSVRWREEDELREFHFFEMDENERVNVTKQKDFTELSNNEKTMERNYMKVRQEQGEEEERRGQQQQWQMRKIIFTTEILSPTLNSTERGTQEEREKNVLGLFLPPGAILPDTALEPDVTIPVERTEPITIPVEDVNSITKVCDYRTHSWPDPKPGFVAGGSMMALGGGLGMQGLGLQGMMGIGRGAGARRFGGGAPLHHHQFPPHPENHLPHVNQFPPQMVPNPILSPNNAIPQQAPDYNPWSSNIGFGVPPPTTAPPSQDLVGAFGQFGNAAAAAATLNMNLGVPPPVAFPPNPFAFPPPSTTMMNGTQVGGGIMDYGTSTNLNNRGGNNNNHRGGGGGSRFDNNDRRAGGRDRSGSRDRDYRDDRSGGGRDSRDRDYRRGGGDRDYRNNLYDKGNRNDKDFGRGGSGSGSGGGRNIRKEIPCRFFKKGFCTNGSRCEFLHEASNSNSHHERKKSSSPPRNHDHSTSSNNTEDENWESNNPGNNQNSIPDSAQSPPQEEQVQQTNYTPRVTSRFSDAPSSPTEDSPSSPVASYGESAESTKVIPV